MELLGRTLKDQITGLTGIADQYVESLRSEPRYSIQPQGDGKSIPEGYNVDIGRCVLQVDAPSIDPKDVDDTVIVELGDRVEDLVTGTIGIAAIKTTFINGCVYFTLFEKVGGEVKEPKTLFVIHSALKILEKGHFQRLTREANMPPPPPNEKRTGGPVTRSERR